MNYQPSRFATAIRNQPFAAMMVLVVILLAAVAGAFVKAKRTALEHSEAIFDRTSEEHRHFLGLEIGRSLLVPEVLATSRSVRALLLQPTAAAVAAENEILEETANNIQADAVYVMDRNGDTLASSNWRRPDSFVGKNYGFRPYFKQALAGRTGTYIAKGMTSLKVGYYLARPVMTEGSVGGAIVAKLSLDTIQSRVEQLWQREGEIVLIADGNGVVSVSPLGALMFTAMRPIPAAMRNEIEAGRQYGESIALAPLTLGDQLSDSIRFVEFKDLPHRSFLQKSHYFPDIELQLYQHVPASRYWTIVAEYTGMSLLLALIVFLVSIGVFQRWTYRAKLMEAAIHDPLTGLNTRLYMNDWCNAAIRAHSRDARTGFGLVVFDLDLFKRINDTYGHLAGDAVLRQVGAIIRGAIRGEDLAVRFGGEELAVFVRAADEAMALALAERIRHSVEQAEFRSEDRQIPVTVSGGVACHAAGETLDALFARADKMLYQAKELGRNRICA